MKIVTFIIIIFSFIDCFSQDKSDDIILLAEAFHKYHHTNDIDYSIFTKIDNINNPDLIKSKFFVSEIIKPDNDILNTRFLNKPDTNTLKFLFIIRAVNYNMFKPNPDNNKRIIERLNSLNIDYNELLAAYYNLIFGSLVNKHDSLDLWNTNYDLNNLNLKTPEEKAIFFLVSMERFGSDIWGYINIPDRLILKVL